MLLLSILLCNCCRYVGFFRGCCESMQLVVRLLIVLMLLIRQISVIGRKVIQLKVKLKWNGCGRLISGSLGNVCGMNRLVVQVVRVFSVRLMMMVVRCSQGRCEWFSRMMFSSISVFSVRLVGVLKFVVLVLLLRLVMLILIRLMLIRVMMMLVISGVIIW